MARFDRPRGVAVDSSGNLYVADYGNNRIRKITSEEVVTTLAGSGTYGHHDATGTAAQFKFPQGIAVDSSGILYVADTYNHRIRKITPAGEVTTIVGDDTAGGLTHPKAWPWIHSTISMWRIQRTTAYGESHRQGLSLIHISEPTRPY